MIPDFPSMRELTLADKRDVETLTAGFPPYSDFNFTSLWAWDTNDKRMISQFSGNLIVRFTDYTAHEPFLSFLGANETKLTARTLIDYCSGHGLPMTLKLVPEISVRELLSSDLTVAEDRDNFDYVCSTSEHETLDGSDFKRTRNFIRRFERDHPAAAFHTETLAKPAIQNSVREVLRVWEENKREQRKPFEIEHERAAVERLFKTAHSHELLLSGVYVEGAMVAFSIDELLPERYCISHFVKADIGRAGVYDYLLHRKAAYLRRCGAALVNYEQDLGLEGLRKSKMSYRPVFFLRKYRVSLL